MGQCEGTCQGNQKDEPNEIIFDMEEEENPPLSDSYNYDSEKNLILTKNLELISYVKLGKEVIPVGEGKQYQGQVSQDGTAYGQGVFEVSEKYVYKGEWVDGVPNGMGKVDFKNGDQFEGKILDGLPNGKGTFKFADGVYEGDFENGLYHGKG